MMVGRIVVGLRQLQPSPPRGPGIDMQAVQFLVEEIGTSLSPGAQDLMDMVHIQQKVSTEQQKHSLQFGLNLTQTCW